MNTNVSKSFTPFIKLTTTEDEIREGYRSIAPYLDLADLVLQYQDTQCCDEFTVSILLICYKHVAASKKGASCSLCRSSWTS